MNHINIFFRHVFECASLCSSEFECSAFYFNAKEKNCQLGKKDEIKIALSSTPANSIPIHINEDLKTELDDEKLLMKRFSFICNFLKY